MTKKDLENYRRLGEMMYPKEAIKTEIKEIIQDGGNSDNGIEK